MKNHLQEKIFAADERYKERDYWLNQLAGDLVKAALPYDYKKTGSTSPRLETREFKLCEEILPGLKKLSKESDAALHIILAAAVVVLVYKYTGLKDIIIGTPIYKQEVEEDFINTALALRNTIDPGMNFKELLLSMRETVLAAVENQNYPIETLLYNLKMEWSAIDFPLFDIVVLLENIHDKKYLRHIKTNMAFYFQRSAEGVGGMVRYNLLLYKPGTAAALIRHLENLLGVVTMDIDIRIAAINILSGEEKKQLLLEFNDNRREFPAGQTVARLIENHAAITPHRIAVTFADQAVTYRELNERARRLANHLKTQGVQRENLVGTWLNRSIVMVESIFAIWKAGGAYIPIDPGWPLARVRYIMADACTAVVLTNLETIRQYPPGEEISSMTPSVFILDRLVGELSGKDDESQAAGSISCPGDLAYVIFTSGSTGQPKGVLVEQIGMMNHMQAKINDLEITQQSIISQNSSHTFDISVWQFFAALACGGRTVVYGNDLVLDPDRFIRSIEKDSISILEVVPSYLSVMLDLLAEEPVSFDSLCFLLVTGETVKPVLVSRWLEKYPGIPIVNAYGPTEASDDITHHIMAHPLETGQVPIGKPVQNLDIYIVDEDMNLCPLGIKGEICVSGVGVGRGYLNNPGLTAERFLATDEHGRSRTGFYQKFYKTGDLGSWLQDGTIDFFGRKDYQVKIRGFRIETGEIEARLAAHQQVKEAVVLDREDDFGNKYLCAYVVWQGKIDNAGEQQSITYMTVELQDYLLETLPDYMVPMYFIPLERMPLTANGKIDRKALPVPIPGSDKKYAAPRNAIEKKLTGIWSSVLAIREDTISIDANFFEIGGQSLRATILVSRIHKELNVKLPLTQLFEAPTIRQLAQYIKEKAGESEDRFVSIEPVEKKEYYPLSSAQKRLYILQQLDLESIFYNMSQVIPFGVDGQAPGKKIEKAFIQLINRHESLRTSFLIINEVPVQRVCDPGEFEFKIQQWEGGGEEVIEDFTRPFDLSRAPLVRVGLQRKGNREFLLMVDMHHIIADGFSHDILEADFIALYEDRQLPPLRLQYKDFSQWQNREEQKESLKQQESYWIETFSGELPVLNLPCDYPRPLMQSFAGSSVTFVLTEKETRTLRDISRKTDVTLYMCILAVYTVLLSKLSSQEDIIVGTPIAARGHADLEHIIGMFANTLAMRNWPQSKKRFEAFLIEVKKQALEAYENQEYQFEDLVDRVSVRRDTSRNPIFDVMFNLLDMSDYTGYVPADHEQDQYDHRQGTSKFDLNLTAVDMKKSLLLNLEYCTRLFKPGTINRFIGYFRNILAQLSSPAVSTRAVELSSIDIVPREEKERILEMCRGVEETRDIHKTVHQWFEEQAAGTPDRIAVLGPARKESPAPCQKHQTQFTYHELNRKSNQLARILRRKGAQHDTVIGLMAERSLEMIIAMLAIMKTGSAYLPIDRDYPGARKRYMLENSNIHLVLTNFDPQEKEDYIPSGIRQIDLRKNNIYSGDDTNPVHHRAKGGANLLYVIYTSGSTGKPKGVMLEHRNLVNLMKFQFNYTNIDFSRILQFTAISFDVSFQEIFSALLTGGELFLTDKETRTDIPALFTLIEKNAIKTLFLPMSFLKMIFRENDYIKRIPNCITHIVTAGEQVIVDDPFREYLQRNQVYLHNHYGPSEAHVVTALTLGPAGDIPERPAIGRPVLNTGIYILDKEKCLLPVGVPGELHIGGIQVGRGYLNNPELTFEKHCLRRPGALFEKTAPGPHKNFLLNTSQYPNTPLPHYPIYVTGDLARWLGDGNIEFLGRIDNQVKIRGFRVEPGEIESQLLNHPGIKEAVVVLRDDISTADKYLCAYIAAARELAALELRKFLSRSLPGYMVPAYFVFLDKIPLTPSGKIDRPSLPVPELKPGEDYTAPGSTLEKKLVELWAEVLAIKKETIGIDHNFFELGGHSLKAVILTAKIHKKMNVKVPLAEIFKTPFIRGLAGFIQESGEDRYASIEPVEKKEYYTLSSAQKRLYVLQHMDPQSTAYNMPEMIPLNHGVDREKLEETFKQLIHRHESLRTSFHMIAEEPAQRIHDKVQFEINFYDSGRQASRETGIKNFIHPFDLSRVPLLRVGLLKTGDKGYLLMVDMHHIISDGVSHVIVAKEFLALYNNEELPRLRLQYKDFSEWQSLRLQFRELKNQEKYWLERFKGHLPFLNLPTDFPRTGAVSLQGTFKFEVPGELTRKTRRFAAETGSTIFIFLLAVYTIMIAKYTNREDIVVGCPIAGRSHEDLNSIIGMFVNMVAMRNFPVSLKTFREFFEEVKENAISAFENQDYQFEELVGKLEIPRHLDRNPLTDIILVMQNFDLGSRRTQKSREQSSMNHEYQAGVLAKFDVTFGAMEAEHVILLDFDYRKDLFKQETIEQMGRHILNIMEEVIENPGIKISGIKMLAKNESEELKKMIKNSTGKTDQLSPPQTGPKKMEANFDF